jgi:hypothetical protein
MRELHVDRACLHAQQFRFSRGKRPVPGEFLQNACPASLGLLQDFRGYSVFRVFERITLERPGGHSLLRVRCRAYHCRAFMRALRSAWKRRKSASGMQSILILWDLIGGLK